MNSFNETEAATFPMLVMLLKGFPLFLRLIYNITYCFRFSPTATVLIVVRSLEIGAAALLLSSTLWAAVRIFKIRQSPLYTKVSGVTSIIAGTCY